jgi:hypothetical protein
LVSNVAASHGLSTETVAAIVAKTDGVPLFAEELTKSVMESAGENSAAVPATLKDSLMARLDRLGEAREAAQIAAVIGRQFTFSLLDAVALRAAPSWKPPWSSWSRLASFFPKGAAWNETSLSSMRSCGTPPMRVCFWPADATGTSGSAARWKGAFPN